MKNPFFTQTPEEQKSLNKHIEETLKQSKADAEMKKSMKVDCLTFLIDHGNFIYKIVIAPKGKGFYNVMCDEYKSDGEKMRNTNTGHIQDHFSHTMSMNKAKDLLLIFLKHWNR